MSTQTTRPNYWTNSYPCPHNEMAFSAIEDDVWCETCGQSVDTNL